MPHLWVLQSLCLWFWFSDFESDGDYAEYCCIICIGVGIGMLVDNAIVQWKICIAICKKAIQPIKLQSLGWER